MQNKAFALLDIKRSGKEMMQKFQFEKNALFNKG